MNEPCTELERIAKIELESENTLSVMKEFKNDFMLFKRTFTKTMIGLMVSIVMAAFYLGSYKDLPEDFARMEEKVSSLEDVVFTHGLYERKK